MEMMASMDGAWVCNKSVGDVKLAFCCSVERCKGGEREKVGVVSLLVESLGHG